MKGFIRMVRDVSDVAYDASAATIINANAISSIQESQTWEETIIGTTKLLEPSANDISGLLFGNTIIQGTDLSGIIIGDNNQALNEYSIALGQGANASGTAGFVYRDRDNNTFVFDSGGSTGAGNLLINGTNPAGGGGTLPQDIPNNLDVSGTIEVSGIILPAVHSAEGSSQSVNTELDPSKNPLMTKGMLWINKAQDVSGWDCLEIGTTSVWATSGARQNAHIGSLGGLIYVMGGYERQTQSNSGSSGNNALGTNVFIYNPAEETWINKANFDAGALPRPPARKATMGTPAVALGGKLYCVGNLGAVVTSPSGPPSWQGSWPTEGYDPNMTPQYFDAPMPGNFYDPSTNTWTGMPAASIPRLYPSVAALGGKLYVCGGLMSNYGDSMGGIQTLLDWPQNVAPVPTATCEVYDPIDNSWNSIASMATPRCGAAMVSMGGKLYIAGGIEYFSAGTNAAPACSPSTTPSTRRDASGTSSAEVYDPIKDSWSSIASMSDVSGYNQCPAGPGTQPVTFDKLGSWFFLPASLAFGNKFYVVGGTRISGRGWNWSPTSTGQVYDPIDNTWNFIPNLPFCSGLAGTGDPGGSSDGRAATSMCECGGKFYLIGGIYTYDAQNAPATRAIAIDVITFDPSLVQMPQITHQGEDFYLSVQRGGPKTFIIPHPEHEGKMLRHACLEAPTRGTNVYEYQITTTEDNQTTEIALPSYFKHINGRARVYVSASEQNGWGDCRGAVNDELTMAIIETEKSGIYNVMITGVRKDPEAVTYSATENIDEPIDAKDI